METTMKSNLDVFYKSIERALEMMKNDPKSMKYFVVDTCDKEK